MRDTIVVLFQRSTSAIQSIVCDVMETFTMAIEPVRPGKNIRAIIKERRENIA